MTKATGDIAPSWVPPYVELGCALDALHDNDRTALMCPPSNRCYDAATLRVLFRRLVRVGPQVRGSVDGKREWIGPGELWSDWRGIDYQTSPVRGRAQIKVPVLVSRHEHPTRRVLTDVFVESELLNQLLQPASTIETVAVTDFSAATVVTRHDVEVTETVTAADTSLSEHEPSPKRSRRRRREQRSPQTERAAKVLRRLYPKERYGGGWPTREEVTDIDLVARAEAEYKKVEGRENPKSKWGPPSRETYLNAAERR